MIIQSLFQVCNALFASSQSIANRAASQWLPPFACLGLTHAPARSLGLDRKYGFVGQYRGKAATAYNERFCVIAAVSPQIMQCKLASYYPAGSSVEAATTQSRHHVGCKFFWKVPPEKRKWMFFNEL